LIDELLERNELRAYNWSVQRETLQKRLFRTPDIDEVIDIETNIRFSESSAARCRRLNFFPFLMIHLTQFSLAMVE